MKVSIKHILGISACFFAILFLLLRAVNKNIETSNQVKVLQDSLVVYRDKDGKQVARISVLTGDLELLRAASKNDSTLVWLLKVINENKRLKSALVSAQQTILRKTTATYAYPQDTVVKDSLIYLYPRYNSEYTDKWVKYSTISSKDSTTVDLKIYNEYEVTHTLERKSIFKPYNLEVRWKNLNPYSEVVDLRSYDVNKIPNNKNSIGIFVGYGVSVTAPGKPSPVIGVGYQRALFTF